MPKYMTHQLSRTDVSLARQIISYMDQHYQEDISADSLAERFAIPVKRLRTAIRSLTGLSVHQHLNQIRLDVAKHLLTEDEFTIKNITAQIGFKTQSQFGAFFKDHTGITPQQYRISTRDIYS